MIAAQAIVPIRPAKIIHFADAIRMQAVERKMTYKSKLRVDPHRGAGEPAVAERADGHEFAAVARVAGLTVPTQRRRWPSMLRGRIISSTVAALRSRDVAMTASLSIMVAYVAMSWAVLNRPAWPATPAHFCRARVVHVADEPLAVALFRGGCAGLQIVRRQVARVFHAELFEDLFLGKFIDRLSGDAFDDLAEQNEADVGVFEPRARLWRSASRSQIFGLADFQPSS